MYIDEVLKRARQYKQDHPNATPDEFKAAMVSQFSFLPWGPGVALLAIIRYAWWVIFGAPAPF